MTLPSSSWMITATGRKVKPAALDPADVCIEDIAHHLSHLCRFTGATRTFYSVAEHSLLVAALVAEAAPDDARAELAGLLHDATEAYLADLATPVKVQLEQYRAFESTAWSAIARAFGLPADLPECVKRADLVALAIEKRDLIAPHPDAWPHLAGIEAPANHQATGIRPSFARRAFLERFEALREKIRDAQPAAAIPHA